MGTLFYLVRHGIKEKTMGDAAITAEGIQQAYATARHFCSIQVAEIVYSPLKRAQQTAAILAKEIKVPISEDHRLRERANWGDIPGQTFEEFVQLWERCTEDRDYTPPGGESARQAGRRLTTCLLDLSARFPRRSILVVTHGGLITDFLTNVITENNLLKHHPNFLAEQSYLITECSITIVSLQDGVFRLEELASSGHLK